MAGESTTVKELHLGFKGSDGKTKRIVITHPQAFSSPHEWLLHPSFLPDG